MLQPWFVLATKSYPKLLSFSVVLSKQVSHPYTVFHLYSYPLTLSELETSHPVLVSTPDSKDPLFPGVFWATWIKRAKDLVQRYPQKRFLSLACSHTYHLKEKTRSLWMH